MDNQVKKALSAALDKFPGANGAEVAALKEGLFNVFGLETGFLEKVEAFDSVIDEYPAFEQLREVFFDLLMINFFASDVKRLEADYLDSDEWADIEEETIDRGTELLNLLLYINECHDEGIKPELGDFLKEFLLVEEDEFQDEFHIYEALISNQQLAESSVEEICKTARQLEVGEELEDLFVPMLVFFHQPRTNAEVLGELERFNEYKEFDLAVYSLISSFNEVN